LMKLPEEIRKVMLLEERGHDEFVVRFQQTTGAAMAKGVEDTEFYRYIRLLALNEVGGDPGRFGMKLEEFHRANGMRPVTSLLAGTTHDTKRSADVRARIGVLAGMAERWSEHVHRWHDLNAPLRKEGAPDWTEELFIYQTLAGAWPLEPERLEAYLEKALREAKRNTSWVEQNERWETSVRSFCRALYTHEPFLADFEPFVAEIAEAGERAAIGQLVLRLTSPGVPDIYQGDELTYLALVDPDNRRPVDWDSRREALADGSSEKLNVIRALLALRARRPESLAGAYEPVAAAEGTCAYLRGEDVAVAVAYRGGEPEVELPHGLWREVVHVPGAVVYERT
jgi:(1->4)-alpha-D-glucan 1-alpha-D-glucosylmutase